jgi:hypothetical protein
MGTGANEGEGPDGGRLIHPLPIALRVRRLMLFHPTLCVFSFLGSRLVRSAQFRANVLPQFAIFMRLSMFTCSNVAVLYSCHNRSHSAHPGFRIVSHPCEY